MHKCWHISVIALVLVSVPSVAIGQVPLREFKNCTELRKVYPRGVAKSAKTAGKTGAKVNAKVYAENIKSDRDKDGISCEK
ncbi:MAG: excalibur calcium-binding domain-containing protein [Ilumatobacteraceae bacterium]